MHSANKKKVSLYSTAIIRLAGPVFAGVFGLAILSLRFIEYPEIMKVRTSFDTTRTRGNGGVWMVLHLPANGRDKVRPGMKVLVHLDDYPYYRYGVLEGIVSSGDRGGRDTGRTGVELTHGLLTDHGTVIPFRAGLEGDALIIRPDVKLYQRLFRNSVPASTGN